MGITWKDHITNVEVLRRANISSMEAMIARSQLRWTSHIIRMSEEQLPRALLFAELKEGTRPRGRPRLRFKDTVKRRLTLAGISYQQLEKLASDQAGRRSVASEGTKAVYRGWVNQENERRRRRHAVDTTPEIEQQ